MKPIPTLLLAAWLVAAAQAQSAYSTRSVAPGQAELLVRFDVTNGAIVDVGSTQAPEASFRGGLTLDLEGGLWGYANDEWYNALGLYWIDTVTGLATFVGGGGTIDGDGVRGFAVEPVSDRLIALGRVVGGKVRLYDVDPETGLATVDAVLPAPKDPIDTAGLWIDPTGRRFVVGFGSIFYGNPDFAQVYEVVSQKLAPLPQGLGYVPYAGGQAVGYEPANGKVWIVGSVGWSQTSLFEVDRVTGAATLVLSGLASTLSDLTFEGFDAEPQGFPYCVAVPNSTGAVGALLGYGSPSALTNLFELRASDLPPNQFGMFLVSPKRDFLPMVGGSQGNLCLDPKAGIGRYPVQSSGAVGAFARQLDLRHLPGGDAVLPGDEWYFQAWYRDMNPGATSNFTRGLRMPFE